MSDNDNPSDPTSYDVGYGKPPQHTQFQPGRSGNPRGRPRRERRASHPMFHHDPAIKTIREEARRKVKIRVNGRVKTVSVEQAIVRRLTSQAMSGDRWALKTWIQRHSQAERENLKSQKEIGKTVDEYRRKYHADRDKMSAHFAYDPDFSLPHPDDFYFDADRGTWEMLQPETPKEKKALEKALKYRDELLEAIEELSVLETLAPVQKDALRAFKRTVADINRDLPVSCRRSSIHEIPPAYIVDDD